MMLVEQKKKARYPATKGIEAKIIEPILGLGIMLQAFGAVYKPESLGFFAASPGVPLLFVAALLSLPNALSDGVSGRAWALLFWGIIASFTSLASFGWQEIYGEKFLPLFILTISWMAPFLCIAYINLKFVKFSLIIAILICLIGYIISDIFPEIMPDIIRQFIFGEDYQFYSDPRPRSFMPETSQFGNIVARYAMALFLIYEINKKYDQKRFIIFLIFISICLFFIQSKGAGLSIALVMILTVINKRGFLWAVVALPIVWLLGQSQIAALGFDLENYTSTSTRVGLWLAGSAALTLNPFGWGYYGFYGTVSSFGDWAIGVLSQFPINFWELESIVYDMKSVSYKSSLLDFGAIFGLPFWFFVIYLLRRMDFSDARVRSSVAFFFLSALSTSGHDSISFFLGLALLFRFFPKVN